MGALTANGLAKGIFKGTKKRGTRLVVPPLGGLDFF